jgi:hypothetical protein
MKNAAMRRVQNNESMDAPLKKIYEERIEQNFSAAVSRVVKRCTKKSFLYEKVLSKLQTIVMALEAIAKLPLWVKSAPSLVWMYKFADLTLNLYQLTEKGNRAMNSDSVYTLAFHTILGGAVSVLWWKLAALRTHVTTTIETKIDAAVNSLKEQLASVERVLTTNFWNKGETKPRLELHKKTLQKMLGMLRSSRTRSAR